LRRFCTNGCVTGNEQRDSEQSDVQTFRAFHFGSIPPSAGHIRIDLQVRGAGLLQWNGRMMFESAWEVRKEENWAD
jgi:hypothetical protein